MDIDKAQWASLEFDAYITQAKKFYRNVFYVNSICDEEKSPAYGGAFAVLNNKLNASLDQGKEDILVVSLPVPPECPQSLQVKLRPTDPAGQDRLP